MDNDAKWNTGVLRSRGILNPEEDTQDLLARMLSLIAEKDSPYFGKEDSACFISELRHLLLSGKAIFGTPILAGLGKHENKIFAACTVISIPQEGGEPNYDLLFPKLEFLASNGIGVGLDLSELSDPVSAFEKIDKKLMEIDSKNRKSKVRPVACMLTLDEKHPEIENFINAKTHVSFAASKCNISVKLDPSFMTRSRSLEAKKDEDKILSSLINAIHRCGEPGVMFWDRIENENPSEFVNYLSTAPCGEIGLVENDCCFFGYVNILEFTNEAKTLDYDGINSAAQILTRALDAILDCALESSSMEMGAIRENRRIGVGVLGFASALSKLGIPYGGNASLEVAENICEVIEYSTKKQSVGLAMKKGMYPGFLGSKYQNRAWRERKMKFSRGIVTERCWKDLLDEIERHGLRNSSTIAFPPTGNSSRILGVSPSFEPFLSTVSASGSYSFSHEVAKVQSPAQGFDSKSATEILPENHIRIASVFQRWADGGASKTLNLSSESSYEDIKRSLMLSYDEGLKCISIFRENCLDENFFPRSLNIDDCKNGF